MNRTGFLSAVTGSLLIAPLAACSSWQLRLL